MRAAGLPACILLAAVAFQGPASAALAQTAPAASPAAPAAAKSPTKTPEAPPPAAPLQTGPVAGENLIRNGDFEQPNDSGDGPRFWQAIDNLVFFWTTDPAAPARGKVIKVDTSPVQGQAYEWWINRYIKNAPLSDAPAKKPFSGPGYDTIAGLDGGWYWSDFIPIKPDRAYRVYVDVKGGGCKVFVRGYEKELPLTFGDEAPAVQEVFRTARGEPETDDKGRPIRYRLRYVYQKWFPAGGSAQWQTYAIEKPAHPTSRDLTKNVRYLRIMLYPYWPPAEYWFDNIRVVEVDPDSAQANPAALEADYREGKIVRPANPVRPDMPAAAPAPASQPAPKAP